MNQRRLFKVRLHRIAVSHPQPAKRDVSALEKARQELQRPVSEAERRRMTADYLARRAGQVGGLFGQ
jgi:hypothetical protein